jgi:hypothetical protein
MQSVQVQGLCFGEWEGAMSSGPWRFEHTFTLSVHRSTGPKECFCCKGPHVYSYALKSETADIPADLQTVVENALHAIRETHGDRRFRVTIEELP